MKKYISPLYPAPADSEIRSSDCSNAEISSCGSGINTPCEENHTLEIITKEYNAALRVSNEWIVPACNQTAQAYIPGLRSIHVGCFLWSYKYGSFEVVAFNPGTHVVTLRNLCLPGTADPGFTIPANSQFLVDSTPCALVMGTVAYLTSDFIIPAIGNCVTIEVTNTSGIQNGYSIAIGTSIFVVSSIINETTLQVCNLGYAGSIGATLQAKNLAGTYQYPIIITNSSSTLLAGNSIGPVTLDGANLSQSVSANVTYNNPSSNKAAQVFFTLQGFVSGNLENANTNLAAYNMQLQEALNGGVAVTRVNQTVSSFKVSDDSHPEGAMRTYSGIASIAPLESLTLEATFELTWQGVSTSVFNINTLGVSISGIVVIS